jgi:hypothetical protein
MASGGSPQSLANGVNAASPNGSGVVVASSAAQQQLEALPSLLKEQKLGLEMSRKTAMEAKADIGTRTSKVMGESVF